MFYNTQNQRHNSGIGMGIYPVLSQEKILEMVNFNCSNGPNFQKYHSRKLQFISIPTKLPIYSAMQDFPYATLIGILDATGSYIISQIKLFSFCLRKPSKWNKINTHSLIQKNLSWVSFIFRLFIAQLFIHTVKVYIKFINLPVLAYNTFLRKRNVPKSERVQVLGINLQT